MRTARGVLGALSGLVWIAALAPLWIWLTMLVEAISTWLALGRWPAGEPYQPYTGTYLGLGQTLSTLLCLAVVVTIPIVMRKRSLARQYLVAGAGLVVLWLATYLLLLCDPGGIISWGMD